MREMAEVAAARGEGIAMARRSIIGEDLERVLEDVGEALDDGAAGQAEADVGHLRVAADDVDDALGHPDRLLGCGLAQVMPNVIGHMRIRLLVELTQEAGCHATEVFTTWKVHADLPQREAHDVALDRVVAAVDQVAPPTDERSRMYRSARATV